jgi:hypothetical protein
MDHTLCRTPFAVSEWGEIAQERLIGCASAKCSRGIKVWAIPSLKWMSNVVFQLLEYGRFPGDPASTIWKAFTKLAEDLWLSKIVLRATDLRRELLAIALLGGQSELDGDTTR